MTGKTMLYDADTEDQFGIGLADYGSTFEQFSKEFKEALWQKSRHIASNTVMAYGSSLSDPRMIGDVVPSMIRIGVLFAVAAGYVELTDAGQADLSQPIEIGADNVLELFPAQPHEEN